MKSFKPKKKASAKKQMKKEPNENSRTELHKNCNKKYSIDRLNTRMERIEERLRELQDRTTENTHWNNKEKNRQTATTTTTNHNNKNLTVPQGFIEQLAKNLIFLSFQESWKESKELAGLRRW